jgi:hypothetical protein
MELGRQQAVGQWTIVRFALPSTDIPSTDIPFTVYRFVGP